MVPLFYRWGNWGITIKCYVWHQIRKLLTEGYRDLFSFAPLIIRLSFNGFDNLAVITLQLGTDDHNYIYSAGPWFFHARAHCPGILQVLSWLVSKITSSMQPHMPEWRQTGAAGLSLPQAVLPVGTEKSQGLQAPMGKWEALSERCHSSLLSHTYSVMCQELQCICMEGSVQLGTGISTPRLVSSCWEAWLCLQA